MARLSETDREALRALSARGWRQGPEERSPRVVAPTTEARERYCRWASEAAEFFKGVKPVRFDGSSWKL